MDDCQEQASFTIEIAMDQALSAPRAGGYGAGGGPLEAVKDEEFRCCLDQG